MNEEPLFMGGFPLFDHPVFKNSDTRSLIKSSFFSLMLRYKIFNVGGDVWVEQVENGLYEFRKFNYLFQKHDEDNNVCISFETLCHPSYNGILDANEYMTKHYPEVWSLVLHEMTQDKYHLFTEEVQSLTTIQFDDYSTWLHDSTWIPVLETVVNSHLRVAANVIFDRNSVTKNRRWFGNGYCEFIEQVSEEFFQRNILELIREQENMYNKYGNNEHSFVDFVRTCCSTTERLVEEHCSADNFLAQYWEHDIISIFI